MEQASVSKGAEYGGFHVTPGCQGQERLDMLRGLLLTRPPEEIADWLGPTAPELVKLMPELAAALPDVVPAAALEPEQDKRRRFHALVGFVARVAARGPLLVSIEDLHWCDDTSLEFLLALARRIKEAYPHVRTVFGGANFDDEMGPEYVRTLPWVDYAVIGEGDEVFPALV